MVTKKGLLFISISIYLLQTKSYKNMFLIIIQLNLAKDWQLRVHSLLGGKWYNRKRQETFGLM